MFEGGGLGSWDKKTLLNGTFLDGLEERGRVGEVRKKTLEDIMSSIYMHILSKILEFISP